MVKRITIVSLIVFIAASLGFFLITVAIEKNANAEITQLVVSDEEMLVQTQSNIITNEIGGVVSDLEFAAHILQKYGFDSGSYDTVADIWQSFSDKKQIYDQIRYIDAAGDERIRINYDPNGAVIVEQQDLQNKKDRYYFTDSTKLDKGQIYISKLDLNIENGEIEQPIKPMIRLATPVISETGEHLGIVIVNYYAKTMIDKFDSIAEASTDVVYLLNEDGYWLSNNDDESFEWAFMYDDKQDIRLGSIYPQEWQQIKSSNNGSISSNNGIFTYTEVTIANDDNGNLVTGEGSWIVLSYISPEVAYDNALITSFWQNFVYILKEEPATYIAVLLISAMSAVIVAMRKRMDDRTRFFSEYDVMTKVFNRRAGMRLLEKIYKEAQRKSEPLSICFIDVNGLKEVNDNLGHEAGDELLRLVVETVKKSIRKTDILTRIGGDEFLLILPAIDMAIAEAAWQRINRALAEVNAADERDYLISVSHGIEQFRFTADEKIDEVINAADALMYQEKSEIKKELEIIKKK